MPPACGVSTPEGREGGIIVTQACGVGCDVDSERQVKDARSDGPGGQFSLWGLGEDLSTEDWGQRRCEGNHIQSEQSHSETSDSRR